MRGWITTAWSSKYRYDNALMAHTALVLRTAGTNCDREMAHAFEVAGARTRTVHLNQLIEQPRILEQVQLIGFPGGFSYGDDIAAGRIFAARLRHRLLGPLRAAAKRGVPIIGICNGFQVLIQCGLLPDPQDSTRQTVTLAYNHRGRFIDRWVPLKVPEDTVCLWTRGLGGDQGFELPIAHGEGRFVAVDGAVLARLRQRRQIALRYDPGRGGRGDAGANPNGSIDDIAGICDPTGVILGLMPHPERYTHATHHPRWTRQAGLAISETPAGLKMFENAVEHVHGAVAASANR